jgi:DNA-binding MarR family transcriptional regulator
MVATSVDIKRQISPAKSRLRLWIQLIRSSRSIETEIRDRLRREFDETLPRFDVMAALYRNREGMMMSRLSKFLMVSNGNVTGIVDRLVKDGLAVRSRRDGDRRTWIICLTDAGTRIFEKIASAHELWIDELLENYDVDQAEALNADLSRLNKNWQADHE